MTSPIELPVTFGAGRTKTILLLGISLAFVALGIWVANHDPLMAGFGIVFFGLCALVGVLNLLPNAAYLKLTESGFEFASLFRRHFTAWSDVIEFHPIMIGANQMVGWNYHAGHTYRPSLRKVSSALAGVEAALPDTYGHKADDLARLMNGLRSKYAK